VPSFPPTNPEEGGHNRASRPHSSKHKEMPRPGAIYQTVVEERPIPAQSRDVPGPNAITCDKRLERDHGAPAIKHTGMRAPNTLLCFMVLCSLSLAMAQTTRKTSGIGRNNYAVSFQDLSQFRNLEAHISLCASDDMKSKTT
jgi:hypothetical protein